MSDKDVYRKFKPERLYLIRILLENISVMRRTHVMS